MVIGIKPLDLI